MFNGNETNNSPRRRLMRATALLAALTAVPAALLAQDAPTVLAPDEPAVLGQAEPTRLEPPRIDRVPEQGKVLDAAAVLTPSRLYPLRQPCRLIDTRDAGVGALTAGSLRGIATAQCGVSPTAAAISINVVATGGTAGGFLTVFASGTATPNVATVNYAAYATKANNATVGVGAGAIAVYCGQASGSVHAIIDAYGYWDNPSNNQPPIVNAGADQVVQLPGTVTVTGTVTDDGKVNATPTLTWSKVSGPGTPNFTSPNALSTVVSFDLPGNYTLRLSAFDGGITGYDDVNVIVNPSVPDLVRFLEQSTMGPSPALIGHVQQIGLGAWFNEQFALPSSGMPYIPPAPSNVPANCNSFCQRDNYSMYLLQNRFFLNAMYGNDQLRQRAVWTLHQLFVVSGRDINVSSWYLPYWQILDNNAFGNYRQLLQQITLNPAMGIYLNMAGSNKNNPNENFAREILQLFSIGTDLLNPDGTPQLDQVTGDILPSYDQNVVTNMAKILTGWNLAANIAPGVPDYNSYMIANNNNHDTTAKQLLVYPGQTGVTPAGLTALADLNIALDMIFNHPNVGPFIARHYIRQMVTSNPTPAYVGRVAAVFNNNGLGVRGDLKAVIKAVLLDPEARGEVQYDPNYGQLREPVLFETNVLRMWNPRSANLSTASDGVVNNQAVAMGQDVWRPATVFSYYPADYLLPGSTTVLGPEFGVQQATTALKRANFVNTMVFSNIPVGTNVPNGTAIDFSNLVPYATSPTPGSPTDLVDYLNHTLMHSSMSLSMYNRILATVVAVPASNPQLRAKQALYLVLSSSQYWVKR
jgi:uncharacterized protein (DUF1800 family)